MRKFAAFVRLSRLGFSFGGFAGFGLGAAVAAYEGARITPGAYAMGQTMVTAFQLMTHYANEFFDRDGDARDGRTPFSGGSGVVVSGELSPRTALRAALVAAGAGTLVAGWLAAAGLGAAALLGVAIGAGAWAYSAPPLRLAARGWGELDTSLVVAVLVPLAGYAAFTGRVDGAGLAATVAPACAMFVMMLAVEVPDRAADTAAGKRNLVVRLGQPAAARLAAWGTLPIVPALVLCISRGAPLAGAAFGALLIAPILAFIRCITAPSSPPAEVAGRGVGLFGLTIALELLGFVAFLR
jgi:1,4-dihydroxy-2-naphthoate octaprenyltransferase